MKPKFDYPSYRIGERYGKRLGLLMGLVIGAIALLILFVFKTI